jgi:hypothetical protein
MLRLDTTEYLTNGSSIAEDTNSALATALATATTAATNDNDDHDDDDHCSSLWKKATVTKTGTTTMDSSRDSSRVLPMTLLLPKPSTPAQWKASFRTSTDDELRSLLVVQQQRHHRDASNGKGNGNGFEHDLSPLGAELRKTASRIKEYRALEKAILDADADADTSDSSNTTTTNTLASKHGVSSAANAVCFYRAHHPAANHHDDAEADAELIDLCLRILEVSSSSLSLGRDTYKRTMSASTISISSNSSSNINSGRTHTRGESKTTTTTTNANSNATAEQHQQPPPIIIPTLSKLRQKLVPSKLKEHVFWESLWVVLYERKKIRGKQAILKRIEHSANATVSALALKKQHESCLGSNNSAIAPNERNRIAVLEKQLNDSWECISELTVRIRAEAREREATEELAEKLWLVMKIQKETSDPRNNPSLNHDSKDLPSATKTIEFSTGGDTNNISNQNKNNSNNNNNNNTLPCIQYGNDDNASVESSEEVKHESVVAAKEKCQQQQQQQQQQKQHAGQWEMSKDSLEFLAFPSEAKEALRTEKQKRLARVNEEMAFILDSDHPKDSRGEWSCCHKANYNDVCGSPR